MMKKIMIALAAVAIGSSAAVAQDAPPATPLSVTILQNSVGQLAGQNALLMERLQKLAAENAELHKRLKDDAKPAAPPPK